MKIAIFTDTYHPEVNGVPRTILNSVRLLSKKGHKIMVFAPKYKEKIKELKIKNVEVLRFFSFPMPTYKEVRIVLPNITSLLINSTKFNPDVVHVHTPGAIGFLGVFYSRIHNKPLVGTYHTTFHDFVDYISPLRLMKLKKSYKRLKKNFFLSKSVLKGTNFFYNKCSMVISPSYAIKDFLYKNNIKSRIEVVSGGVELKKFIKKKAYNSKKIKVLHVGRISYEKDINVLIEAFSILTKKKEDIELIIVGKGPAYESVKRLIKMHNLEGRVYLKGYIPDGELYKTYAESDIFITTSTIETLGLVILEAMASGLPVIGVDKLAVPEVVKNNYNGLIAQPNNPHEIASLMYKLASSKKLRESFGKNSLKLVKFHNTPYITNQLERLYQEVVDKNFVG